MPTLYYTITITQPLSTVLYNHVKIFLPSFSTNREMNSSNVKDRDGKLRYLEKIVHAAALALAAPGPAAKPSKIIAGQEAAKTNEFLQQLGRIIDEK